MHEQKNIHWNRRDFVGTMALAGMALPQLSLVKGAYSDTSTPKIYMFSKPIDSLKTEQLMRVMSQAGLDGVDLAVRSGGHVLPEDVEKDLPQAVAEAKRHNLEIKLMTTRINSTDSPMAETILKTASDVGIQNYRMGYFKYDFSQDVVESLDQLKPQMRGLAALNKKYGIHAAYQNHVGTRVGGQIWDLWYLMHDIAPEYVGCEYDIRHAVAEGGEAWPVSLRLIAPWIKAIVIKDFVWKEQADGKYKPVSVPLGEGMVDFKAFFSLVKELKLNVPYSLHFEYDLLKAEEQSLPEEDKLKRMTAVIKRDTDKLKEMMQNYL